MADSLILVTSATATGGIQQIVHKATTDFNPGSCLSYLALISIEVWSASSNNRNAATLVGEIPAGGQFIQTGLARNTTRYSWYRAKDASANVGDWYPAASNAGIVATTSNETLPANSVGPVQTGNNFSTVAALSADFGNITAGNVTGVTFTGGVFRTAASGKRIEIKGADNFIRVYNSSGQQVVALGEYSFIPGWSSTFFSINANSVWAASAIRNQGLGPALTTLGQIWSEGIGNKAALRLTHQSTGADAHGIWFDVGPSSNQGGAGVLGVSKIGGSYCLYMNRGGIGPFTGQHPALVKATDSAIEGDILVDLRVLARIDIDNTVTEVETSNEAGQCSAVGVLSKRVADWSAGNLNLPRPLRHLEPDYH